MGKKETPSKELAELCSKAASDKKAVNIKILDVRKLTYFCDYFVICSGLNEPQVQAIANGIQEKTKKKGIHCAGVEGYQNAKWILLDYGSVVIHIFYDYVRDVYDLETLWSHAPLVNFQDKK
ncbi:MAG TPA: ribosome silencing factor [Bdellovibrionota bacterium]|nr:ribosome silencing factor [Bdellovibrionota bacterium]